jgi:hypothetical protein
MLQKKTKQNTKMFFLFHNSISTSLKKTKINTKMFNSWIKGTP